MKFIEGHYYFPSWARPLLQNIPSTTGKVKFINLNQNQFLIPKLIYDSLVLNLYRHESYPKADEYIVK